MEKIISTNFEFKTFRININAVPKKIKSNYQFIRKK